MKGHGPDEMMDALNMKNQGSEQSTEATLGESEDTRKDKIFRLLHTVFPETEETNAPVEPSQIALWDVPAFLESFGCCNRSHREAQERDRLNKDINRLRTRRETCLTIIAEVEQEVIEIGQELAKTVGRCTRILDLMKKVSDEPPSELDSPTSARTPMKSEFLPRAVLEERYHSACRELNEVRQDLDASQKRLKATDGQQQKNSLDLVAVEESSRRLASLRGQELQKKAKDLMPKAVGALLNGVSWGDQMTVKRLVFQGWARRSKRRTFPDRFDMTIRMIDHTSHLLCFYRWKMMLIERRGKQRSRFRSKIKGLCHRFADLADHDLLSNFFLEWCRLRVLEDLEKCRALDQQRVRELEECHARHEQQALALDKAREMVKAAGHDFADKRPAGNKKACCKMM